MSLSIENLSVLYRDGDHALQALEDVHLTLTSGRCLALVGESGSGKTTLGLACLGLLPRNASLEGTIRLNGRPLAIQDEVDLQELRGRKVTMVFQNGIESLNPVYRVIDQVAEPLVQRMSLKGPEARSLAKAALMGMGLDVEYHTRYPHELSGGQAQRVLLAMGLILDPEAIILDEPTASLDALNKGIVSHVIGEAKAAEKAILLITHDLEFAVHNADTIAVLYLGQIMEVLPAKDLLAKPLHPYTLALVRSFPGMDRMRDLGGIRGDAFYRMIHQHGRGDGQTYRHSHIQVPESIHANGHAPPMGCLFQNRCTQALESCRRDPITLEPVEDHTVRCLRRGIADLLILQGVSKIYGQVKALYPSDLILKCGEVLSLVGETGSGKTTLAMILAGVLKPDGGSRAFEGRDMEGWKTRDYRSLARRIGVVYQNPTESVSHRFTVEEIVAEPLRIHEPSLGGEKRRERVKRVLREVHLSTDEAFLGRYPHELNMGAIQRVCMARALVLGPALLVADEPTSFLDPSVQAKVLKLLLDLQVERGLTMLFVTHDVGLARKISDRIGIMLKGSIVELGPATKIISEPAHPYTRLLLDSARGIHAESVRLTGEGTASEGCPFALRCPRAGEDCRRQVPVLESWEGRLVACHFPLAFDL
ncbi:MAG: ABC transporter ATP-binding protein [Deltaproteobacteria bacterium]|nr:ABC transporter ATP-binding protein [Deltaproteobacteria bacterium]